MQLLIAVVDCVVVEGEGRRRRSVGRVQEAGKDHPTQILTGSWSNLSGLWTTLTFDEWDRMGSCQCISNG